MCYNPSRLLCVRGIYKGVIKTAVLFRLLPEEYQQGYAVRDVSELSRSLAKQCYNIGVVSPSGKVRFDSRIELPCRNCLDCTRQRAREWSVRCQLEAMNYPADSNFFVTVTYNDHSIPLHSYQVYDSETESFDVFSRPTLSIEDCQRFMKTLRKGFERKGHNGIRFFACGEYGPKTKRPHYHYIFFNLPLNDLYFWGKSKNGFDIFRSPTLEKAWNRGFIYVQRYSIETARYVAQYCTKKLFKEDLITGIKPEFLNMSRRPAIGVNWFFNNMESKIRVVDGCCNDHLFLPQRFVDGSIKSVKFPIPKAFLRRFKPITNSALGIDTELPDLNYFLNDDGELFIDVLEEITAIHQEEMISAKLLDLERLGFSSEDLYNDNYDDYLAIKKSETIKKFVPTRKEF